MAVADLWDQAIEELGPLLKRTAQVVEAILQPEQTYVASWAHEHEGRKHLHTLVQPVATETVREYGGPHRTTESRRVSLLRGGPSTPSRWEDARITTPGAESHAARSPQAGIDAERWSMTERTATTTFHRCHD